MIWPFALSGDGIMRVVRGCSSCLLGFTQLRHNTTPFEFGILISFESRIKMRKQIKAEIIKFKDACFQQMHPEISVEGPEKRKS